MPNVRDTINELIVEHCRTHGCCMEDDKSDLVAEILEAIGTDVAKDIMKTMSDEKNLAYSIELRMKISNQLLTETKNWLEHIKSKPVSIHATIRAAKDVQRVLNELGHIKTDADWIYTENFSLLETNKTVTKELGRLQELEKYVRQNKKSKKTIKGVGKMIKKGKGRKINTEKAQT